MKKKICIITSSFPSYKNESKNAGVFVRDFALLLTEKNFEVHVLAPFTKGANYQDDKIHVHFFPWFGGEMGLSSYNPKNPVHLLKLLSVIVSGVWNVTKFVKKNNIDYCLTMWAVPAGLFAYIAKIFSKTPYYVWTLGSDIWKIQDYPFGKKILKKVLANSEKNYADGFELAKDVEIISNRNCEFLSSSRILDNSIKEPDYEKFNPSKTNFMYLGRYHKNKGTDTLIEAINLLTKEELGKSLFHIFGGGPMDSKIKKMVKDFSLELNTFVNGYLEGPKVFSHMSSSDFIVIPSRIESIPVVFSDAIQAEVPVVMTNVGDLGKIGNEYKVGFVTDPTPQSLASGIKMAIKSNNDERKSFRNRLKELKKMFDLEESVKTFSNCIEKM